MAKSMCANLAEMIAQRKECSSDSRIPFVARLKHRFIMPPRSKSISIEDAAALASGPLPLFVQKYSQLRQSADGKALLTRFAADPRFKPLDDALVNFGSHARSFSLDDFVMWFLWCRDELGGAATDQAVERFFSDTTTTVLESQWAVGFSVEATLPLGDDYDLRPIEDMPESEARECYQRTMRQLKPDEGIRPVSAFVREVTVAKFLPYHVGLVATPEYNAVRRRLGVLPLLGNALNDVSGLPALTTSYCAADIPFGPFGTGGGGYPLYDVVGRKVESFPSSHAPSLMKLLHAYEQWLRDEGLRLQLLLYRLCQAKRHSRAENQMLDLGITLEMALLEGRTEQHGVSAAFRQRGAALLAKSPAHRAKLQTFFRRIYDARSSVAHNGTLFRSPAVARDTFQHLPPWLRLASRIVRKLLIDGPPDWRALGAD